MDGDTEWRLPALREVRLGRLRKRPIDHENGGVVASGKQRFRITDASNDQLLSLEWQDIWEEEFEWKSYLERSSISL